MWKSKRWCTQLIQDLKGKEYDLTNSALAFRKASILAQSKVRRDDNLFLGSFVQKVEKAGNQKDYKKLWQELKRFLPRQQGKKRGANVRGKEYLKEQWAPHLCQMEAGKVMDADNLYHKCLSRQNMNQGIKPTLAEVPSLLAVEWALRGAKSGRQGGLDRVEPSWVRLSAKELAPLLWKISLKQSLWGVEALQFKGGTLAMLQKPGGSKSEASGYRGILLSSELGKRLQALTRRELIAKISPSRPALQIGGFAHMEPAYGAHFVRSYMHFCAASKCSCVVIFIDLKAAYHSLIRQLLTGRVEGDDEDMEDVYKCLRNEGLDPEQLEEVWSRPSILEEIGASTGLQHRMVEYNQDTWANLFGVGCVVRTSRGSRPGSPMADAQFSSLMSKIGHILQKQLQGRQEIATTCSMLGIDPTSVIWADDLALIFPIQDCKRTLDITTEVMTEAQEVFAARGLTINFKKGKSEALITLCGQGARNERKKAIIHPFLSMDEKGSYSLRLEGRYRHLGTFQQCGGSLDNELSHRVATTWASFRSIRQIMTRPTFDLQVKLRLMQSLLLSRLLYGAGAWGQLSKRQIRKLHSCYLGLIRVIVGKVQTKKQIHQGWSDQKILAMYELPCIRTLLATARLGYAQRLWCHGGEMIRMILAKEEGRCKTSWMKGLRDDLKWVQEAQGGEWGDTLEETCTLWLERKGGWKAYIRGAQKRHTLQESLSFRVNAKFGLGNTGGSTAFDEDEGWLCGCGAWFSNKRALQVHRHRKHGAFSEIYGMVSGSVCPACLTQFWTSQRLHMHLQYQPRDGRGNRCYSMIATLRLTRDPDSLTETSLPLQGIQRRDAVRCDGPLWFGMDVEDEERARHEIAHLEDLFAAQGLLEPIDLLDDDLRDEIDFVLQHWDQEWKTNLEELQTVNCGFKFVVNLLFCGRRHAWQEREHQEQWHMFLKDCPLGNELFDWFDLRLRVALVERIHQSGKSPDSQETATKKAELSEEEVNMKRSINSMPPDLYLGCRAEKLRMPGVRLRLLRVALAWCN